MASKHRVLIVEDDTGTIDLLSHIVQRAGYEPILARSGKQALGRLQEIDVDLILLDLMMKEMDGWTLLDMIKSDERQRKLPAIIISARDPREDPVRTQAHADKYVAYFVKPFEVDQLLAQITAILDPQESC